jgi:hypothetical protein
MQITRGEATERADLVIASPDCESSVWIPEAGDIVPLEE